MQELFAIKHKGTGNYLPVDYNTGASYWEGDAGKHPRLFTTMLNARRFVIKWALGFAYLTTDSYGVQLLCMEFKVYKNHKRLTFIQKNAAKYVPPRERSYYIISVVGGFLAGALVALFF